MQHCITTIINPAASGNYLFTRKSYDKAGGYPEVHGSDTFYFGFKQYATGAKIAILPNFFYWHLANSKGYWQREEATRNNQKTALSILLEYSDVFSSDAINRLKTSKQYASEINGRTLRLSSSEILHCLFKGYEFQFLQLYYR